MKKYFLLLLVSGWYLSACKQTESPHIVVGYRPVYASKEQYQTISVSEPQSLRKTGKIYTKDNYVYINEIDKGVHVVDNNDPTHPQVLRFLNIPGNMDIAIKGNVLYANNYNDLVAIDLSSPDNPKVLKRIENAFPNRNEDYPPFENVEFECANSEKGVVIGWEKVTLENPKCYR